jgi:2-polyprenyl-3-methyl-5-hydroxy-6-metoxy-1,4-benzoquinol methylase
LSTENSKESLWNINSIASQYSSSYYDYGILDKFDHFLEAEQLLKYVYSGAKCLDLAGGNGRFTEAMLEHGGEVVFVDLEAKHVENAKRRFADKNINIVCSDIIQFVETDKNTYDLVVLSGILFFMDNEQVEYIIRLIREKLSDRGVIFVRDFIAKKQSIVTESSVFSGATLYYRNQDYYQKLLAQGFLIARPLHRFPKLERIIASMIGYTLYRFIFKNERIKFLTWKGMSYENKIFVLFK